MKLLIIRHGQTDGNVKGLVQGAGLDLPLNETYVYSLVIFCFDKMD